MRRAQFDGPFVAWTCPGCGFERNHPDDLVCWRCETPRPRERRHDDCRVSVPEFIVVAFLTFGAGLIFYWLLTRG